MSTAEQYDVCWTCLGSGWRGGDECPRCVGSGVGDAYVEEPVRPVLSEYATERAIAEVRLWLARWHHPMAHYRARRIVEGLSAYRDARLRPVEWIAYCADLDEPRARLVLDAIVGALREHARVVRGLDPHRGTGRRSESREDEARELDALADEAERNADQRLIGSA